MIFSNTYINLGKDFYQNILPEKVYSPSLLLWNSALADSLGVANDLKNDEQQIANHFSGNHLLEGAEPIALAYSGHQFGHLNPQLGDGRAHLLGEVIDKTGTRRDIQLKGSGRTLFSRQGDGRCALGPAIREYLMSEALFALGVPTSRCLAVVSSGEHIYRGTEKAGAIVTRVASSHIRVGTFQYFAIRSDMTSLMALTDYSINRHFAFIDEAKEQSLEKRLIGFLKAVMDKQLILVVHWLRVGFIHGVMNTDNTPICGETLDFGPCAMMNKYNGNTVFSSIDVNGRYAFDQQGDITLWNMSRLAECLMMLMMHFGEKSQDDAITIIEPVLMQFKEDFKLASDLMYANKLGFSGVSEHSIDCVNELLNLMKKNDLDYTNTFVVLTQSTTMSSSTKPHLQANTQRNLIPESLSTWFDKWHDSLKESYKDDLGYLSRANELMKKNNPVIIPRNHQVEQLLTLCEMASVQGDISAGIVAVTDYLEALKTPYVDNELTAKYAYTPESSDDFYQTFCGT